MRDIRHTKVSCEMKELYRWLGSHIRNSANKSLENNQRK